MRANGLGTDFLAEASQYGRGGPLAAVCGARTRSGRVCTQLPLAGGVRCLRHAGPKAAAAHRARQMAGLRTGRVTPEVFARAEARRARNRLLDLWKRNPSVPGATIDLGADEGRFQDALDAFGVRSGTDLPAMLDWLRWRFRRCVIDRADLDAFGNTVREGLPKRLAAAEAAIQWVRLGNLDRRTRAGRAVRAALKSGGEDHAAAVAARLAADAMPAGVRVRRGRASGLTQQAVRPWADPGTGAGRKRRRPDRVKQPPAAPKRLPKLRGRPSAVPDTEDDLAALADALRGAGPAVGRMFGAIIGQEDQLTFLRDLVAYQGQPGNAGAQTRWREWVRILGGGVLGVATPR